MSFAQKIVLAPLPGADSRRYSICLLGPLALGIQITLTALLTLGPANLEGAGSPLNDYRKTMAHPENDLLIFLLGSCLTMGLVFGPVWYWRAKLGSLKSSHLTGTMTASAVTQGVLAVVSLLACLLLASSCWFSKDFHIAPNAARPLPDAAEGLSMLLPAALAFLCAILDLECGWLGAPNDINCDRPSRRLKFGSCAPQPARANKNGVH